jgi:hypothetical protein
MPIKVTRALLTAALDGSLRNVEFRTDKYFGFAVPTPPEGKIRPLGSQEDARPSRRQRRMTCRSS